MPQHKVLEYRDISVENLTLMTNDEFVNANHAFIDTINEHRDTIVQNKWLSEEDIEEYIVAFRKAEAATGNDDYHQLRKDVEDIIDYWDKGSLNCKRTDVFDDEFYEITDSLYLNMQHTDYLTDAEWHEKYKDLTADKRSEVYGQRKTASDYVDFLNPYRKEMVAAWQLPDGYDWDDGEEALTGLGEFLPKAMTLYDYGDIKSALGISFDLFDMLMVMKSCERRFFIDGNMSTLCPWALAEVALYPICKIYNDKATSQDVKTEIFNRIDAYGKTYGFPKKLDTGHAYEPVEVFSKFGTFDKELDFYDFFGLNPYDIHEVEDAEDLSDEEYETWRLKIFNEVAAIDDFHKLSTEELSLLSNILKNISLYPDEDIEQACSVDQFNSFLDGVNAELQSRSIKSTDIDETTLRSWATSQNADGSWTDVSTEEAYGRIRAIGKFPETIEDIDKDRITFLAYNYYCPTPCTTAKELHAKFMAYETKYRRYDEQSPAFFHRQVIAMLQQESLPLADRLLLYDILL